MADAYNTPHPLHAESVALLELKKQANLRPYHEMESAAEAREQGAKATPFLTGQVEFAGVREDILVPSPHVKAGIPAYVYKPNEMGEDPAIVIYYHGGGMCLGSRDGVDVVCKTLAGGAKCIVVNVEYRLCPEDRFPAPFDDAQTVAEWVVQNKTTVGGTKSSKVGVAGDSAGGNLSSSVAHDVKNLDFQILIYPHVFPKYDYSSKSYVEYKKGPILEREIVEWFIDNSLSCPADARNPRYCPYLRPKFDHLPPALFIVAQCDILRDDSYEYSRVLKAAGVETELELYEGAVHAFYTYPAVFPTLCKAAHERTIRYIKKFQP